jgi:hypothetical protein
VLQLQICHGAVGIQNCQDLVLASAQVVKRLVIYHYLCQLDLLVLLFFHVQGLFVEDDGVLEVLLLLLFAVTRHLHCVSKVGVADFFCVVHLVDDCLVGTQQQEVLFYFRLPVD